MNVRKAGKAPLTAHKIVCDICSGEFSLAREHVKEEEVVFTKGDIQSTVKMTSLTCPLCGKRYPVVIDTSESLATLEQLRQILQKRMRYSQKGASIPKKLEQKYQSISRKLNVQRYNIADTFNGSFYQVGDVKEQLDYRYRVR